MGALTSDPTYAWNLHALPWLVLAAVLLALASVIFVRQRASRVALMFCAMIALVAVWFAGFAGMLLAQHEDVATAWARFALAVVALLPAAVCDFTATALRFTGVRRLLARATWIVAAVFALIALGSGAMVGSVRIHPWGYYPVAGPLLPFFVFVFFVQIAAPIVEYTAEYRRATDPLRRRRLVRLIASFSVVYVAAVDFAPMFGADWQPVGYVPVVAFMIIAWGSIRRHRFAPITAARAAEEILDTMADALFVVDGTGKIRVMNGAVRQLFGFRRGELLGRSIDSLEADAASPLSAAMESLGTEHIRDQERLFRSRDGQTIAVSVSISPVNRRDVQHGAVVIARDIRARKAADEEMRSFAERLQQSNRELEDFAYVASHDLQEPLRKIQAFGDLLKSKFGESLPPQGKDYVDRMQSAARRMQILINDLLTFSRVTTKAQPFRRVDLGVVLRDVLRDLEVRIHDSGGTINTPPALPTIDADPLQMHQLLQNLVANALKFHRPDTPPVVDIEAEIVGADPAHPMCRIVVRDHGIGFEEKYAERIFTMFERLHGRGAYEGTGIGLAVCRKIAQRHHGDIEAHSVPGEGATFIVTIPASQPESERVHADAGTGTADHDLARG